MRGKPRRMSGLGGIGLRRGHPLPSHNWRWRLFVIHLLLLGRSIAKRASLHARPNASLGVMWPVVLVCLPGVHIRLLRTSNLWKWDTNWCCSGVCTTTTTDVHVVVAVHCVVAMAQVD